MSIYGGAEGSFYFDEDAGIVDERVESIGTY